MKDIKSHDELSELIKKEIGISKGSHLKIADINISFDLNLGWVFYKIKEYVEVETSELPEESEELRYYELIIITFENCNFRKIECSNILEDNVFEVNIFSGSIDTLEVIDSIISAKFYINKQYGGNKEPIKINNLLIMDSVFKDNFKLHNAQINVFSIENTDFEKHADFFKSAFQRGTLKKDIKENINENDIGFKGINFRGLALFGNTTFAKKLIFKYVTFESYSHFRQAKLPRGLDLDYANIQKEMNFFDVQELDSEKAKKNTSQETYRIIKHNFSGIGNNIESNKYLALELEKKKINLENEEPRKWLDYLVFKVHWVSSRFGTNWLRAFILICLTSLFTVVFMHFTLVLDVIITPNLFRCEYIGKVFSEFFQYIYILNKSEVWESNPGILLFNKTLLGYLYYQFLVSIRKNAT
mgnify:CR=1 FL=1